MAQHNARFLVEFMAKLSAGCLEPLALDEAVLRRFTAGVNRPVIYGTLCQNRPRWLRISRKKLSKEHRSLSLAEQAGNTLRRCCVS